MSRQPWSRQETLVALRTYCRTPFGRLHGKNPEILEIAAALGRSASALAMKCCNLAAFDPTQRARGVSGLTKASALDQQVWNDFTERPEEVAFEAETAFSALTTRDLDVAEVVHWEDVRGIERDALTKVRVNQQFFRAMVLSGYRNRCAICEMPVAALLVAAHIVPWSADASLRMNPKNGLCLCNLHDRAFDRGLIGIEESYSVTIHPDIAHLPPSRVLEDQFLRFAGQRILLPDRWHPDPQLLQRQRDIASILPRSHSITFPPV